MAIKIDIEDLEMLLVATKIPADKQKTILDEAKAIAESIKEQNEKKNRTKSEFLVMPIIEDSADQELFENCSYIVLQVPENTNKDDVLVLMNRELNEVKSSQRGRKYNISTVGNAISKVKAKNLIIGDSKVKIKTRIPVAGIPIVNKLI